MPQPTPNSILHRLKIASGHLNKVIRMVEEGAYCIDTLTQSQAVQSALHQVDALILKNHLKTCAVNALTGKDKDKSVAEIIKIFHKSQ
jgi:DNA-binding FrmR family transcriptional regulator